MYTDYYGLSFNPFDKQMVKEKDAFESEDFREMTARLEYLKEIRGIGVFTASPGMGKTFALRCFSKKLNPNLYQCAVKRLAWNPDSGRARCSSRSRSGCIICIKRNGSRSSASWMKHST